MKINQIIREKRIELGLTQEQLANAVGVSTPAVNKWEKGVSYPDITLLPVLARNLKIDLNTLFCFHEEMTEQEIALYMNEVSSMIHENRYAEAFQSAMEKIREFPNCYKLILNTAMALQGGLYMYAVNEAEIYEEKISQLYEKCMECEDLEIRYQAYSMMVSKYLNQNEYHKAQALLDEIPNISFDKKQQQGNLYFRKNELEEASKLFESELITTANKTNMILYSMMEIALKEGRDEDAFYFAEAAKKSAQVLELWDYTQWVNLFQFYSAQKDADHCVMVLEKILEALRNPWDFSESKLYQHVNQKKNPESMESFTKAFIDMIKNNLIGEFEFLKDHPGFLKLIDGE